MSVTLQAKVHTLWYRCTLLMACTSNTWSHAEANKQLWHWQWIWHYIFVIKQ